MIESHGITPDLEHFNCLIDLLGRAGRLHEADELLQTTPSFPGICGWRSLLASCRIHGDIDLGKECYGQSVYLYPDDASGYMLMSTMHADACNWDDVHTTEELRKNAAAWKKPGSAWIELRDKIHEFVVGESVCSQSETKLQSLNREIRLLGFIPQIEAVLIWKEHV
jgi:pentatricopeptide repeat protein